MTIKELRPLVAAAVARHSEIVRGFGDCSNPHHVNMKHEAAGKWAAYTAVLAAMDAPRPPAAFSLMFDAKGLDTKA